MMRFLSRFPSAAAFIFVGSLVCYTTFSSSVYAMTVPSYPNLAFVGIDWKNRKQSNSFLLPLDNNILSLSRGGDLVIRSKRRYGNVRGIYLTCASIVILVLPQFSLQVLQMAAVTILISSVLQYTNQKGFL
jgi:hypothetical protein